MKSNEKKPLTTSLILLLSITCGVVVANMYYIQPIGTKVAASLSVSTSAVGILTMLTQLGYALGLLFLVPLGDVVDRPKLIIRMAALSAVSLLAAFFCAFVYVICMRFFFNRITFDRAANHHSLRCGTSGTKSKREGHGYIA